MKDFLRKLKLVDDFTTELEIEKNEFVNRFKEHVDEGSTSSFGEAFDAFSSSKNEYKGHVGFSDFKIKRRKKLFDMNTNWTIATGTYRQKGNTLIISTEVNGFHGMMIPFYILVIAFYIIFISVFMFGGTPEDGGFIFAIPFVIFHAAFMLGIPYFIMRRGISRMKRELEREFFYMTKKNIVGRT